MTLIEERTVLCVPRVPKAAPRKEDEESVKLTCPHTYNTSAWKLCGFIVTQATRWVQVLRVARESVHTEQQAAGVALIWHGWYITRGTTMGEHGCTGRLSMRGRTACVGALGRQGARNPGKAMPPTNPTQQDQ